MPETTALGAAMAAGHALGIWDLQAKGTKVTTDVFTSTINGEERDARFTTWKEAVTRSMHWVSSGKTEGNKGNRYC